MDNATRWNSVYRMLNRAIDVEKRLESFVAKHKPDPKATYRPKDERLMTKDWTYIKRLRKALKAFDDTTLQSQGFRPWLSDWFISLHLLLNYVNDWKVDAVNVQGDAYLATCFTASWNKLEKYYVLVDQTPIYYAAILLNPTLKAQKLRDMWNTDETRHWIEPSIEKVRAIWRQYYKPLHRQTTTTPLRLYDDDDDDFASALFNAKRRCIATPSISEQDAFDTYLSIDPEPFDNSDKTKSFEVLNWWIQRQQHFSPALAKMAFDVFSIPLMSDNNERSFSSGRDMITYRRTCLKSDIIEACQCLKSWYGSKEVEFDSEEAIEMDMGTRDEVL
jgi:hypothetical protein